MVALNSIAVLVFLLAFGYVILQIILSIINHD
jgi:hypothetical protein